MVGFVQRAARLAFHGGLASALFVTAFQPFIAVATAGRVRAIWTASLFLFVWAMYLADRLKVHPEDELEGDGNAAAFARRHRRVMRALFAGLLAAQGVLVALDRRLLARLGAALAISLLYLVRLPLLRRRVKEIAYAKCFYLATTALVLVTLFTPGLSATWSHVAVLVPSFALYFLNFSLFDVKDIEADRRANIRTLAGALAPAVFLRAQIAGRC